MRRYAKALRRAADTRMNKTEAAYAAELDIRKAAGDIVDWRFEALKLRLADNTFYTPDFVVHNQDDSLTIIEVKGGFWRDDARVKIKVAAEQYPEFRFLAVQRLPKKHGGGWKVEEF